MRRDSKQRFDSVVLPHVHAGYNLARCLLRNDQDAEDAVQTAAIRAFQGIDGFRGSDGKAWFLSIVRRSSLNVMRQKHPQTHWEDGAEDEIPDADTPNPEQFLMKSFDASLVNRALDSLPPGLKEMIVLREVEGMAYKEIAAVIDHPIGTVMSAPIESQTSIAGTTYGADVMNCDQVRSLLDAFADGEIDAVHSLEIETHLSGCADCRVRLEVLKAAEELVRDKAAYFNAPDRLLQSISAIGAEKPKRSFPLFNRHQMAWSAINLCASAAAVVLLIMASSSHRPTQSIEAELVADHIRSLQASHIFDVPSSDRHTVKPWFQGKLDFSPDVPNLASTGFPLLGGRLDYVAGHPAAALVYARGKHTINVFVLPASQVSTPSAQAGRDGYHVLEWTEHGLTYWAVSDTDALPGFRDAFRAATAP